MRNKHILSTELIFRIAHELRKQGKTVGLTHGAYDLFHSSHLDLLIKSSKMCDFLIVGVDSDESIRNYKSYVRPIIQESSRLKVVSELNCVDAVFIKEVQFLSSEAMQDLYKEINPNFITIGENFSNEEKIVHDTRNTKIQLKKVKTAQDYTTTKIIERIIELHKKDVLGQSESE